MRKYKTPKAYIKQLEEENKSLKKQAVPWYPASETVPGKRVILGKKNPPIHNLLRNGKA